MPVISRFYGIIIKIYFAQLEHNPPHLHAIYGECIGAIDIQTQDMLEGDLPPKALADGINAYLDNTGIQIATAS